jgi:hypothetical protein
LETIAKTNWTCLVEAFDVGATGCVGEVGIEPLTQQELSHAQRVQQDAVVAWPPAMTGRTGCATASNKLNRMANVAFT